MTDQKKQKPDPKDSAENLTNESAKPVGPAQPIDVPDAPKNRRMFQNGDTTGMTRTSKVLSVW